MSESDYRQAPPTPTTTAVVVAQGWTARELSALAKDVLP